MRSLFGIWELKAKFRTWKKKINFLDTWELYYRLIVEIELDYLSPPGAWEQSVRWRVCRRCHACPPRPLPGCAGAWAGVLRCGSCPLPSPCTGCQESAAAKWSHPRRGGGKGKRRNKTQIEHNSKSRNMQLPLCFMTAASIISEERNWSHILKNKRVLSEAYHPA